MAEVYGIGNPLIDYLCSVSDEDLHVLGLDKGIMLLIDTKKQRQIIEHTKNKNVIYSCGGSCPNTMVTLCSLGVHTTLAGSVGKDMIGAIYKKRLLESGVTDHLVEKEDATTGTSIILLTPDKERTMNTYLGANRLFDECDVDEQAVKNASLFHFTGYMWDTDNQKRAVMKALEICKENNIKVSFDVADPFAVSRYKNEFLTLIRDYVDIVFANREEGKFLTGLMGPKEACELIGEHTEIAIVKNGKMGSYLSQNGVISKIPLYGSSTPVDTTGAGDTYAAGFLYGYLTGRDATTSCNIASYLAGEIISQIGAQFNEEDTLRVRSYINEHFPVA